MTIHGTQHSAQPGSTGAKTFTHTFDYVIVGAPLKYCHRYMDLDATEAGLFAPLQSFRFRTTLFERSPEPARTAHVDLYVDRLMGGGRPSESAVPGDGSVFGLRDSYLAKSGGTMDHTAEHRREQVLDTADVFHCR